MQKYLSDFPELAKEFHPSKNGNLRPENLTFKSGKKVWWKCPNGNDHEWQTSVANRSNGTGCPFCSGNKVSRTNSFLTRYPQAASEWHPTKNGQLKPENFTEGAQQKIWWKCPKGDDHEWIARIYDRRTDGCPFCYGKKVSKTNNLLATYPHVAREWHPTKNHNSRPEEFYFGSRRKVWWKCPNGDDHEWKATIADRTAGRRCPFCYGKATSKANNLFVTNPDMAREWHPTKNGDLRPENFRPHSNKKVWWRCLKDESHEYHSIINNRSKGFGCPYCSGSGTSEPEIRIFCELQSLMGSEEVEWRRKVEGVELDVFIPKHRLGIEFDGWYWHDGKFQLDRDKNEFLKSKNIQIIRVRQEPLEPISTNDVIVPRQDLTKSALDSIVSRIQSLLNPSVAVSFDAYYAQDTFMNEKGFKRFISFFPSPPPEFSLLATHPHLAKQWHFSKNTPLKPEHFTFGSDKSVWWKCPKDDDHEWLSKINNRSNGNGCPFCSNQKASKANNLLTTNPKLASEWHPTKNGELTPDKVTYGSDKKVWWRCSKNKTHAWVSRVANRSRGASCPYCSEKKLRT